MQLILIPSARHPYPSYAQHAMIASTRERPPVAIMATRCNDAKPDSRRSTPDNAKDQVRLSLEKKHRWFLLLLPTHLQREIIECSSHLSSYAGSGSGSGLPSPFYARFALDYNDASSIRSGSGSSLLSSSLSPSHTLRHRASKDRDRKESTRHIQPMLPRRPTLPPPSPPKPVYSKFAPAIPTKSKIPVASTSLRLPLPLQTLTPPSSPNSLATRRAYSPVAAFSAK
ncbi:hypothetical protein M422DRAFT_256454 [Sphaerobolus stellatus SS14]|uniref:Unplaced genomic scaffold SPHSTscaffold_68, whole genome shotgun sequence n=1 Tax=Sphaerobolus stellatus (strain SS14) TaxID=990650 RepID=A0A0C9V078_SPHS4|nr:hypothetical protein M422DRAFT_256454 [Sphaerobolus stellatus SS14]